MARVRLTIGSPPAGRDGAQPELSDRRGIMELTEQKELSMGITETDVCTMRIRSASAQQAQER